MGAKYKAIIFDFDGVIVDSEPLHCQSYLETAATFGIQLSEEQYFQHLIGYDDRGAIRRVFQLFEKRLDDQIIARFIETKSRTSLKLIREGRFRPLAGVDEFVRAMSLRCALGIYSGALRAEIEGMLAGIGLREHFKVITSAEDVAIGKPDPSGYILTAKLLGEMIGAELSPGDCLVIEDAPSVALRAQAVGFNVLGVATTYRADQWPREIPTADSLTPGLVMENRT